MNKVLSNKETITIFVLPAFLLYGVFVLMPIIYNIYLSMFQTDLIGKKNFVLFRSYMNLLNGKIFLKTLKNDRMLAVGSLFTHLPLTLLLRNSIFIKIRGGQSFQSIFFLPSVICGAGVGLLFNMIYNSEFGLLNTFLDLIRLSGLKHVWLSEEKTVMPAPIVVVIWKYVGYHMVIQLVAVKLIPDNLLEAARIDGATAQQQFTKTTYPLTERMVEIDMMLVITGSLKYFDPTWTMTKEGLNHASEMVATYMYYRGFRTMKFGYANTIGLVLLVLCMLVIWGIGRLIRTEKLEY